MSSSSYFPFERLPKKERLASCEEDFPVLAVELLNYGVISEDTYDKYRALDLKRRAKTLRAVNQVKPALILRFIFQKICGSENRSKLTRVQGTLDGNVNYLCGAIIRELNAVLEDKADKNEVVKNSLFESDVNELTELLAEGCGRWEQLSIKLGLPHHERENIRRRDSDLVVKLCDTLTAWIVGEYDGPATVDKLRLALASDLVGLRVLANCLGKFERDSEHYCSRKKAKNDQKLKIVYQVRYVEVPAGVSTLMEVQVNLTECDYEWKKKDKGPLPDGADFSGVSSNILYINRASRDTEGKYFCAISNGEASMESKMIELKLCSLEE